MNKTLSRLRAFSLVELLVVIAVIAIVAGFAVPAVTTMVRGSQLTQGSQVLQDQLSLARQLALSRGRSVELRFYKFADTEVPGESPENPETWFFRAFQTFEILDNGAALPLGPIRRLPTGVILNEHKFSTILNKDERPRRTPGPSDPEMSDKTVKRQYEFVTLRFQPDGSTDLPVNGSKGNDSWFVTLHNANEREYQTSLPANYFTLQIDPVTGSSRAYRPNAG